MTAPVPEINPADFKVEWQNYPSTTLLDVREAEERAGGYIPGSVHIPMNRVPHQLGALDRNKPIVVYCAHGVRSQNVAAYLNQLGFQAISLRGGIFGWLAVGGEITRGE